MTITKRVLDKEQIRKQENDVTSEGKEQDGEFTDPHTGYITRQVNANIKPR
jgi:hypothetical protein